MEDCFEKYVHCCVCTDKYCAVIRAERKLVMQLEHGCRRKDMNRKYVAKILVMPFVVILPMHVHPFNRACKVGHDTWRNSAQLELIWELDTRKRCCFDRHLYLTSCLNAHHHNTCIHLPQTGCTEGKMALFIISQDHQTQVLATNAMVTTIIID